MASLKPPAPIDRVLLPFQRFLRLEASGGILLVIATIAALVLANSPAAEWYAHFWHTELEVAVGGWSLHKSLHHFINDGLMAVFFLLVGLEIKRELLVGELSSLQKAVLPAMAAVGGMVVPALVYVMFNFGQETSNGWGVPMATDIAFAVGVIALLGKRIPLGLKVFLVALAIVDDIGAVLVIAFFYTDDLNTAALFWAGGLIVVLTILNRAGVRSPLPYLVAGVLLWYAVLISGVHATLAGVALAFTIPASVAMPGRQLADLLMQSTARLTGGDEGTQDIYRNQEKQAVVHELEHATELAQAPLLRIEHALLPWVSFVIMPIFALANAGVPLGSGFLAALMAPAALGIALGLFAGKQVGIMLATVLTVKLNLGRLPDRVTWRQIYGASCLAGIGFTMSLFIAALAFDAATLDTAKVGVLAGSLLSGLVGVIVLWGGGERQSE